MQNDSEILYTRQEARRLIRAGNTKFHALVNAGEIETIKVGHRTLVPAASLRAFIDAKLAEARTKATVGRANVDNAGETK